MSIANKNKISFKFLQNLKMWAQDGFQCYSRLWALEWAWHPAETNLRCAGSPRICLLNILALIVSEISASIQTDGNC